MKFLLSYSRKHGRIKIINPGVFMYIVVFQLLLNGSSSFSCLISEHKVDQAGSFMQGSISMTTLEIKKKYLDVFYVSYFTSCKKDTKYWKIV